jgi:hypothetical protein
MKLDFRDVSIAVYIVWAGIVTSMWIGTTLFYYVVGWVLGAFGPMMALTFVWWYVHREDLRRMNEDVE